MGTAFCDWIKPSRSFLEVGRLILMKGSPFRGSTIGIVLEEVRTLPSRKLETV